MNANVAQLNQNPKAQTDNNKMQNANSETGNKTDDLQSEEWYPDSGATNHITNSIQNLNLGNRNYTGTQTVHMGNGEALNITHVGNGIIKGKRQLYLNNLLRVPKIKKKSNQCITVC